MGSMSDIYEKKFLDLIFRNTAASATVPMGLNNTNVWIALGTAGSDAAFTELAGSGYARVAVARTGAGFDAATGNSPGATLNTAAVTFPAATADWNSASDIEYFAIYDAAVAGNLIYWGALTTPKPVLNGDTPYFDIGDLVVTQD
jgi:hypothetical protein